MVAMTVVKVRAPNFWLMHQVLAGHILVILHIKQHDAIRGSAPAEP